jgi:hypothetical protein
MGRDHDIVGLEYAVIGDHPARMTLLDIQRPRALKDEAPITRDACCEMQEVFTRMKLGLVIEADRTSNRERQPRFRDKVRRKVAP